METDLGDLKLELENTSSFPSGELTSPSKSKNNSLFFGVFSLARMISFLPGLVSMIASIRFQSDNGVCVRRTISLASRLNAKNNKVIRVFVLLSNLVSVRDGRPRNLYLSIFVQSEEPDLFPKPYLPKRLHLHYYVGGTFQQ